MKIAAALCLFLLSTLSIADSCKDNFIACVQKTGNPATCQSTYQHCQRGPVPLNPGPLKNEAPESLQIQAKLAQLDGLSTVELWVANPSNNRVQIDNMSYQVRCQNGDIQTAEFSLEVELPAKMNLRKIGASQVICIAEGGAAELLDEETTTAQGLASVASKVEYFFPCANGETRSLSLQYVAKGKGYYRWISSAGSRGVLNHQLLYKDDFAKLACEPLQPANPTLLDKARSELRQIMDRHVVDPTDKIKTPDGGSGVRG